MDDYEIEWDDDDFFGGDIDFNDDFDMDPFKNKSFLAGATDGFMSTVLNNTVGSSAAMFRTARTYLPKSFTTGLDRLSFLKDKGDELIREFQEGNYETVKSLQSIAKNIAGRIKDENSTFKNRLENFSTKDFSSWEKSSGNKDDDLPSMDEATGEDSDSLLASIMDNQSSVIARMGDGVNQMAAQVGGRTIAGIMAGNKELVGIQSGLRDLLDYQRKVQAKLDYTKIELLAKTYVLNAKFYKFMEKGVHTEIKELRKLVHNTGLSDYEKTSNFQAAKKNIRDVVFDRAGGLLSSLKRGFGKEGREDKYNAFESLISNISTGFDMADGVTPSWGMAGNMAGGMIGDWFLSELPRFFNQGPFKKFADNMAQRNPEQAERYRKAMGKLDNIGNLFSYNMNNGSGLLQYYSQYWEDLDEFKYPTYEDYVDSKESEGKKPMPRALFNMMNSMTNQGKSFANNFMRSFGKASGSRYSLRERDGKALSKAGIWSELNNVTLTDVIPGLLRLQYETLEKIRTGNDNFTAPIYSYKRGEFVSSDNAKKVLASDVFNHSSFNVAASNANRLVDKIDGKKVLTPEERRELTMRIMQDVDKEYGFNPYYYLNGIGSQSEGLDDRIGQIMKETFGIDDEMVKKYEDGDFMTKSKMAAFGLSGEGAGNLNEMGALARSLQDTLPNIQDQISAARAGGNSQLLRDLGIIYTKNGRDQFNMEKYWQRMQQYLVDPDNVELRGEIDTAGDLHAGATSFGQGGNRRDVNSLNRGARHIGDASKRLADVSETTTKTLNETIEKLTKQMDVYGQAMSKADFSNMQVNLGEVPDTLTTIKEIVEKMQAYDSRQETLLEQIAGCVCRSAGDWGKLSDDQKKETIREEDDGKRSILERLKAFSPRGMFNKGVETLLNNQPLVLGGMLGGLGVLAMHNPKAAMLISGGMVAASLYRKLGDMARARAPDNDEDILDADGEPILKASKLHSGDYYDAVTKAVIREWKDIKGAIYDVASKSYIALSRLTGRLFGADGRAIILDGLSKVKDTLVKAWKKIDIFDRLGGLMDKGRDMFYQQDVYVKGDKEPRLTRSGFESKSYYCYDLNTNEPFLITGWDKIKGPVYKLDDDNTLTQIISEADIAKGLVTSAGYSIDKMGALAKWTGGKLLEGLGKAKDYGLEKAGLIKEHAKEAFKNDYSGIEDRIDRIYMLLCSHFGYEPSVFGLGALRDNPDIPVPKSGPDTNPIDDIVDSAKPSTSEEGEEGADPDRIFDPYRDSQYPNKVRLNSLQDQEKKKEKEEVKETRSDIGDIAEYARQQTGKSKKKGKDGEEEGKGGWMSKIAGAIFGVGGSLMKFIKNPIGFIGGLLVDNVLKAPGRIIKMGSLMFQGVLGVASPIYKILSWGFGGMMWGLRKLLFSNVETFGDWVSAKRGRTRGRRGRRGGRGGRGLNVRGKLGTLFKIGATAFAGYEGYNMLKGMGVGESSRDIMKGADDQFDRFYGDPTYSGENDPDGDVGSDPNRQSTLGEGMDDTSAALTLGLGATQAIGTAKSLGAGTLAPTGEALGEKALSKVLSRSAGKLGAKAIPLLGQAMMAMDAYEGFTNKDEIGEVFNTNVINGRQRLSNGVANVLDMGGVFSGLMNWAADKTGWEGLRQEGGMTRAIDGALSIFSSGPLKFVTPIGWLSMWETEVSQAQNKLRLAMYGVSKPDSELGRAVGLLEYQLDQYVKFNSDRAWLDEKAPISQILNSFSTGNPQATAQWFKLRFLPVYLTFQSAIRMVGYKSISEFDRSKNPNVLKVIDQVRVAIQTAKPYPLDVDVSFDKDIPIMGRVESEAMIGDYLKEIRDDYKDRDIDADGNMKSVNKIRTSLEVQEGKSAEKASWWQKTKDWFTEAGDSLDRSIYKESPKVVEINISDLHKDANTEIDNLTLVRLAAYGNTDNKPWRVDSVLRLERYCEKFSSYSNGEVRFFGKTNEIYTLFKDSFRVPPAWEKEWVTWFEGRFLPVFKQWFSSVYSLRRNTPEKAWQTLTATNKHAVGVALCNVIVKKDNKDVSVWEVTASPFVATQSGDDSSIATPFINNLEMKATEAKLKMPELERDKSQARDMSGGEGSKLSEDDEKAMMARLTGRKTIPVGNQNYGTDGAGLNNNVSLSRNQNTGTAYSDTVSKALGQQGYVIPGNSTISEYERNAGDFDGKASDYIPSITTTDKGFKISQKEAEKLIINEFVKAGIKDNRVLAFALANAQSETGFQGKAESLNYKPEALLSTFGKRFTPQQAQEYGRVETGPNKHPANQKMIAKLAYGNRYGNSSGDDGWMYRGRGFTQLTFKGNYKAVGDAVGENFVNNPEKVTNDPVSAAKSAAGFFKIHPEIAAKIARGDVAGAAAVIGKHPEGINNKVRAYPSFLKRLVDGDLKNVLSSEAKAEGDEQAPDTEQVDGAPNPNSDAAPVPDDQAKVASQLANSPEAKGSGNVNVPPPTEDGSTVSKDTAPTSIAEPTPAPETPATPEPTPAPAPVSEPVAPPPTPVPAPEPVKKEAPAPEKQSSSDGMNKDGVTKVSDEGVVRAISALSESILKVISSSSSIGGNKVKLN